MNYRNLSKPRILFLGLLLFTFLFLASFFSVNGEVDKNFLTPPVKEPLPEGKAVLLHPELFNKPGNTLITSTVLEEVSPDNKVVWELKCYWYPPQASDPRRTHPMFIPMAIRLKNGNTLITTGTYLVVEVNPQGETVWYYGKMIKAKFTERYDKPVYKYTGVYGSKPGYLRYVTSAFPMSNGNILICEHPTTILEVNRDKEIVWKTSLKASEFNRAPDDFGVFWAVPLENGNILISTPYECIEITKNKKIVSRYDEHAAKGLLKIDPDGKNTYKKGYIPANLLEIGIGSGHILLFGISKKNYYDGNYWIIEEDADGNLVWKSNFSATNFAQRIGNVPLPLKK